MTDELKAYCIWYVHEGEEKYATVLALNEEEAKERFNKECCFNVTEVREINLQDETYLAYT